MKASGDMSQTKLAGRLKVAPGNVNNWMNGKNIPSLESIEDIAGVFGVSAADLLRDGPAPKPNIVELPEAVKLAIEMGNAKLKDDILETLSPFLAKLKGELGVEEVVVRTVPKEKLSAFLNAFLRDVGLSADFYRLLDKNADAETLRVEFLREIGFALMHSDGSISAKAKKVILELSGNGPKEKKK